MCGEDSGRYGDCGDGGRCGRIVNPPFNHGRISGMSCGLFPVCVEGGGRLQEKLLPFTSASCAAQHVLQYATIFVCVPDRRRINARLSTGACEARRALFRTVICLLLMMLLFLLPYCYCYYTVHYCY